MPVAAPLRVPTAAARSHSWTGRTPQPVRREPDDHDEQHAEDDQVDLWIVGKPLRQPDRDGRADQRPGERPHPADDGGVDGFHRPVQGEGSGRLDVARPLGLDPADKAHDGRGDEEGGQLGAEGRHADPFRDVLIVPDRLQAEAEPAAHQQRHDAGGEPRRRPASTGRWSARTARCQAA